MTTSLIEIKETEAYLSGIMEPGDALFFKVRLLTSPQLRWNTAIQQKIYTLIRAYGRKQIRHEIATIQQELFSSNNAFRQQIEQIMEGR